MRTHLENTRQAIGSLGKLHGRHACVFAVSALYRLMRLYSSGGVWYTAPCNRNSNWLDLRWSGDMRGRNDPCACGSGRKYKHCCLKTDDSADFAWRQVRGAEGRLVPKLLDLSLKELGRFFIEAALDEFFLWDGVPDDYIETEEFSSFFVPWFAYEFVDDPQDPDCVDGAPGVPLAALYLERHRESLSPVERAFLQAASTSPLSFWAVKGVVPGREIALHDVLTGADVVVREKSASQLVQAGALLFTRVITVDGVSIMSGCAPLVIPPRWHHAVLDLRELFAHGKGRLLTPGGVREINIELRELYFAIEDKLYNPPKPKLCNTDGDPLMPTTLTYRLHCSPSAAFDRLKALAQPTERDVTFLLADAVMDEVGELHAVSIPWSKKGNRLHKDWDNTTLGTMDLEGDRLEVHVNSERRCRRIEREIAKRLGGDAVLERRAAESLEDLLAKPPQRDPRSEIERAEEERSAQNPEVQAYLQEMAARHWDAWLDTRLPVLGNRTPRQAARSADGRERLAALLADFVWTAERSPNAMLPDVSALRAKLGLPHNSA